MALVNGKHSSAEFAVLLVDGYNMLAHKPTQAGYDKEVPLTPSTGLGDLWSETSPTGIQVLTAYQSGGFFDTVANSIHDAFKAMALTVRLLCMAPGGNEIGGIFIGTKGAYSATYKAATAVNNLSKGSATYSIGAAPGVVAVLDEGVIVQSWTTKTVDWNTATDGTVVDYTLDSTQTNIPITSATKANPCVITTTVPHNLAAGHKVLIAGNSLTGTVINGERTVTVLSTTTFSVPVNTTGSAGAGTGGSFVLSNSLSGGVGHQHVSALSATGFIGKIRMSPDGVTYADAIVFTNVTAAPAAERLTVAGTIDRYLCFDGDITGTSVKPFAGFARG